MLYRGADLIRDVEFVIFDEVHYVNDAEVSPLGAQFNVVAHRWDSEVLFGRKSSSCCRNTSTLFCFRLQYQIRTNSLHGLGKLITECRSRQLIGASRRTKKKDIYVISTPKRPVPLEHYLWAGKELHKIVDASSHFVSEGCVPL
jgi:antiviral helicase SKI2